MDGSMQSSWEMQEVVMATHSPQGTTIFVRLG